MNKSDYIIDHINSIKNKKYEISIIAPLLVDKDLLCIEPYTQYPVKTKEGKQKYIDLYYEQINLSIEILEEHHKQQEDDDKVRKEEIEGVLDCEFLEIEITKSFNVIDEIKNTKDKILKLIEEKRKKGEFNDWEIIQHKKEDAKSDYENAIFVNANNFTEGTKGPFKINDKIRENADLLVIYSGNTITRVFEIDKTKWEKYSDPSKGYIHNGTEIPNHELLSSGGTEWGITTNRFYGKNLEQYIIKKTGKNSGKLKGNNNMKTKPAKNNKKLIHRTTNK